MDDFFFIDNYRSFCIYLSILNYVINIFFLFECGKFNWYVYVVEVKNEKNYVMGY